MTLQRSGRAAECEWRQRRDARFQLLHSRLQRSNSRGVLLAQIDDSHIRCRQLCFEFRNAAPQLQLNCCAYAQRGWSVGGRSTVDDCGSTFGRGASGALALALAYSVLCGGMLNASRCCERVSQAIARSAYLTQRRTIGVAHAGVYLVCVCVCVCVPPPYFLLDQPPARCMRSSLAELVLPLRGEERRGLYP